MQSAEAYCDAHKLQPTPVRRKVLELLLEKHQALGAYAILDLLREGGMAPWWADLPCPPQEVLGVVLPHCCP